MKKTEIMNKTYISPILLSEEMEAYMKDAWSQQKVFRKLV